MIQEKEWKALLKEKQEIQKLEEKVKEWQKEHAKLQLIIRSNAQKLHQMKEDFIKRIE